MGNETIVMVGDKFNRRWDRYGGRGILPYRVGNF